MLALLLSCTNEPAPVGEEQPTEEAPCARRGWYLDADGDGLGVGHWEDDWVSWSCEPPSETGYATSFGDCYDADARILTDGLFLETGGELEDLSEVATGPEPLVLTLDEEALLVVCDGTWLLSLVSTAPLTIEGEDMREARLSGGGQSRVLTLHAPAVLRNVHLTQGYAEDGGALWTDSDLFAEGLRITESFATGSGGGLFQEGADALLDLQWDGALFCSAGISGGGMALEGTGVLRSSRLSYNYAPRGGAMHLSGDGSTHVDFSEVTANEAGLGGGALVSAGHELSLVDGSALSMNTAVVGGGVAVEDTGRFVCSDSRIQQNNATEAGGASLEPVDGIVSLSSSGCDWGETSYWDNEPTDVGLGATSYVATNGEWSCTGSNCELETE